MNPQSFPAPDEHAMECIASALEYLTREAADVGCLDLAAVIWEAQMMARSEARTLHRIPAVPAEPVTSWRPARPAAPAGTEDQAADLVRVFAAIENPEARRALLDLARTLASADCSREREPILA